MRFNTGTGWGSWMPFDAEHAVTLLAGDGEKTVSAEFKDAAGNVSPVLTDTIGLDETAPTGSVQLEAGAEYSKSDQVELNSSVDFGPSGAHETEAMRINVGEGWGSWLVFQENRVIQLLEGDGEKTVLAQFKDSLGHESGVLEDTIEVDTTAPSGSIAIAGGVDTVQTRAVTLNADVEFGASGAHGDSSDARRCRDWLWLVDVLQWRRSITLPAGDGVKTVSAQFQDKAGNKSEYLVDTVVLKIPLPPEPEDPAMDSRIAASNRYSTAVEISKSGFDSAPAVAFSTGLDFPDALSAGALASAIDGPLLLVKRDSVSGSVLSETPNRPGATKVYAVGGLAVISETVLNTIKAQTRVTVTERQWGASRYGTAKAIALRVRDLAVSPSTVFLATGQNFPDALAASSLAANQKWPILLTKSGSLPYETAQALSALNPPCVVICGGTAAVSDAVRIIQGNPAYGSPVVVRKDGANRYETAKNLVNWAVAEGLGPSSGIDGVFLATGTAYPDALSGGVLAERAAVTAPGDH